MATSAEPTLAFIGVDVGTGSARAGVFDKSGGLLGEAETAIQTRGPQAEHFEQSSEDIWRACCSAVRSAVTTAKSKPETVGSLEIGGIAFDATCSLVVLGDEDRPLAVGADLPDDPAADIAKATESAGKDASAEPDPSASKERIVYLFKSARSGNYLHVPRDAGNEGEPVVHYGSMSEGSWWNLEQVEASGTGIVALSSVRSGQYLHVPRGAAGAPGGPVVQESTTSDGSQWIMEQVGDGSSNVVLLRSVRSGHYLHVPREAAEADGPVVHYASNSEGSQWLLEQQVIREEVEESSKESNDVFNIIVWCDHRATAEAEAINASGHKLLSNVGGAVSPEMEMPKLAWLKKNRPKTYASAKRFFDLADFLTYRAADGGGLSAAGMRSMCTVVCKWNFDATARNWDASFLEGAGLSDLGFSRIGAAGDVSDVGSSIPGGLGSEAAAELGLLPGIALGVGIIDAHAGGLGCLGAATLPALGDAPASSLPVTARLALIAGTSTCHMASSELPIFVPGVWGPYDSAMIPGLYLQEGGQSAAGAALDFLVETHIAYPALCADAAKAGLERPVDMLAQHLEALTKEKGLAHQSLLTAGVFVGPDLNGNRSPLADPRLRGSVIGIGPPKSQEAAMTSVDELAVLYLAAVQALAYSTRAIIDAINKARAHEKLEPIQAIFACGGLARNDIYIREHADAVGKPIYLPEEPGAAMPLGGAILAASAAGAYSSVTEAMQSMGRIAKGVAPSSDAVLQRFHNARYEIFKRMQRHQQEYRTLEAQALAPLRMESTGEAEE